MTYGSPETQPGGRALKFYATQRLDIRRIQTLKDGGEAVGNRVRVKVVKNKVASPFKQAEFDIEFGNGISRAGCLLDLGCKYDVVSKSGAHLMRSSRRPSLGWPGVPHVGAGARFSLEDDLASGIDLFPGADPHLGLDEIDVEGGLRTLAVTLRRDALNREPLGTASPLKLLAHGDQGAGWLT